MDTIMKEKKTTLELIDEYIDTDLDLQMTEGTGPALEAERIAIRGKLNELATAIREKQLNIKQVMVKRKTDEAVIKAEMDVHRDFIAKLNRRKKAINNVYDFLQNLLITTVENVGEKVGEDKFTFENNGHKFTVFQTHGSLEILEEDKVPEDFKHIIVQLDKAGLRKHVCMNNGDVGYAVVPKVKRLKIT